MKIVLGGLEAEVAGRAGRDDLAEAASLHQRQVLQGQCCRQRLVAPVRSLAAMQLPVSDWEQMERESVGGADAG